MYDSLLQVSYKKYDNFKDKHLWIKKATGLGITEFMLRFMAWLCVYDNSYRNSQMCIVTGPNQDIAIKLIKRLKGIFEAKLGIIFQDKENYTLIQSEPWKGNLGRRQIEHIDNKDVIYIYYKNGKVSISIACSNNPFKIDNEEDLVLLYSFFGHVRNRFEYQISDPRGRISASNYNVDIEAV